MARKNQPKTLLGKLCKMIPMYYKTEKYIKVDVWFVGLFYRIMQLLALSVALAQLYFNNGWAMSETPGGMSNAWDEPGTFFVTTDDPDLASRTAYCSNASYSFADRTFQMEAPACEALMAAELTSKTMSSIFFTTAIIETDTIGWACADPDATARNDSCAANDGEYEERSNGQCRCVTSRTVYPLAVDEMLMAFEHAYATSADFAWTGSSADPSAPDALRSRLHFPNATVKEYAAGEVLALPLREWLSAANLSLDELNPAVAPDPQGRIPRRRSTGVQVRVDIEYSNVDIASGKAVPGKRSMHADISLRAELATWTGVDSATTWVEHPMLPRSQPQPYHLIERARHGVLFQFVTSGQVFKWDWM
jgi:hypothetical protein